MSINAQKQMRAAIQRHVRAGRLFCHNSGIVGDVCVRGFFMSVEVEQLLSGPWVEADAEIRVAKLRADIDNFVRGNHISVCIRPHKAKSNHDFGLLHHPSEGIWDYRSRSPKPGIRIFGHFAAAGLFVALTWHPRSQDWNGRQSLGDKHNPLWDEAKNNCRATWDQLFPNHSPFTPEHHHECFTGKTDFDGDPETGTDT